MNLSLHILNCLFQNTWRQCYRKAATFLHETNHGCRPTAVSHTGSY